jgi:hypothetical protein
MTLRRERGEWHVGFAKLVVGAVAVFFIIALLLKACEPAAPCTTMDEAATAALAEARACTKNAGGNREFAGNVFAVQRGLTACFAFEDPVAGLGRSAYTKWDPSQWSPDMKTRHPNPQLAANYHSHPSSNSSSSFSVGDLCDFVATQRTGYLVGTNPGGDGEVRRFVPNGQLFDSRSRYFMKKCLMNPGSDWCTTIESYWDWIDIGVGTINELRGVPTAGATCPPSSTAPSGAAASQPLPKPPSTEAEIEGFLSGCSLN